jgi:hypothetical protein
LIKTQHSQDILINDIGQRPFDKTIIERYKHVFSKNLKNTGNNLKIRLKASTNKKMAQPEAVEEK